jgi:hypothetical protein
LDLRPVTAEHHAQLAAFRCATHGDDFSIEVHHSIRTEVHDELSSGRTKAVGSWDDDTLAAPIVYVPTSFVWSRVHRDNAAMRLLNHTLGAVETRSDEPGDPYLLYTLPL